MYGNTFLTRSFLLRTSALILVGGMFTACSSVLQSNLTIHASPENSSSPSLPVNPIRAAQLNAAKTPIATVLAQGVPNSSVTGAEVVFEGKITQVAPLLNGQVYELTDETGKIWVISPLVDLPIGEPVGDRSFLVQGVFRYQSIPAGGKEWGEAYVEERERFAVN